MNKKKTKSITDPMVLEKLKERGATITFLSLKQLEENYRDDLWKVDEAALKEILGEEISLKADN